MTNDRGAGTAYRSEMREAIKAFFQPDQRVDLTNLLNDLVAVAYRHHREIYLAGNQARADRIVGSNAELASADYVEDQKNRDGRVEQAAHSAFLARAEPLELVVERLADRVGDLESWREHAEIPVVRIEPEIVECKACAGRGRTTAVNAGFQSVCPGCKGAGVHRV